MQGYLVAHRLFGLGKICEANGMTFRVSFFESQKTETFDRDAFEEGDLRRFKLPIGSRCASSRGECVVDQLAPTAKRSGPITYRVTFADGLKGEVDESDLSPLAEALSDDPLDLLAGLQAGSYRLFHGRESLVGSLSRWRRAGGGLRALLSSRIDVRAHQAFVAGMVLLDGRRRYLLADEVGLGKTIEAGLVIHDLLSRKPDARILIVCPAALTQQWFCELYSKFGGHTFTLPELHSEGMTWNSARRVIIGMTSALCYHSTDILSATWDMVIVDEAHHVVSSASLYQFVLELARATPSILLLSALPAQRRKDELIQLLTLLEPDRFGSQSRSNAWFEQLFDLQPDIGRKLSLLRRRVEGLTSGEFSLADARQKARELLSLPLINDDEDLSDRLENLPDDAENAGTTLRGLMQDVADRYRVNRRILRNRRQHLIEQEQISDIQRVLAPRPYVPDQLESDVVAAAQQILLDAQSAGLNEDFLLGLARVLWQSLAAPPSALAVATQLIEAKAGNPNARGREFITLGHLSGYGTWNTYLSLLSAAARGSLSAESLKRFHRYSKAWSADRSACERLKALLALLRQKGGSSATSKRRPKLIIFAGFPGLAIWLVAQLRREIGVKDVTEFREDIEREEKEANVNRFRSSPDTWIMVSDESGGEGRNFQFASELIHFDTPWSVHTVEQRIGRLDRLGREQQESLDVISNVLVAETTVEEGLIHCFAESFLVYKQSISGLEFALRDAERTLVLSGIDNGLEGILQQAPSLRILAEEERARDESEGVLDEASFDRTAAQAFRRIRESPETENHVEEAFCKYISIVASQGAAGMIHDEEFPTGLCRFRTDRFVQIRPPSFGSGTKDMCVGTFRRHIAQKRFDLEFFTVGNPFFDAITESVTTQSCGRTYAINAVDRSYPEWAGFEFVFVPAPHVVVSRGNLGFFNRMEQLFAVDPIHVFVSAKGEVCDDTHLMTFRSAICPEDKGKTWQNFTKEKARALQDVFGAARWVSIVRQGFATAREVARSRFQERLGDSVSAEERRLEELTKRLEREAAAEAEFAVLREWKIALREWEPRLDSCGFLSLNNAYLSERQI